MSKKFAEYSKFDLSNVNKEVLKKWQDGDIFHKSLEIREGHPSFVFYEGPPSANGMPGIHHVIARSIKDIFCRYKTMKGYLVNRKAGWDTHGLPVELGVEKSLGITKEDIGNKISVAEYNAACRRDVMKFTKEWTDLTQKMGYWVDLENPYITYDNRYIETLWYLLKELYNKKLLYKGYTIQPYSPAAGTGLSSHELNHRVRRTFLLGLDYYSVDFAIQHGSLCGSEYYVCSCPDLQSVHGYADDSGGWQGPFGCVF